MSNIMDRMMRGPLPWETVREPGLLQTWEARLKELPADHPDRPIHESEVARLTADVLKCEIHRLTVWERWDVTRYVTEARKRSEDMSTDARIEFVQGVQAQAFCYKALRVPGTQGKVLVFPEDYLPEIDGVLAHRVRVAYDEAFSIPEADLPKVSAPR